MSRPSRQLADRYLVALRDHLAHDSRADLASAEALGHQALRMGMAFLDVAEIHELALVALLPTGHAAGDGNGTIQRAGVFFRQALLPLVTAGATPQAKVQMKQPITSARAAERTAATQRLQQETGRRKTAENALKESQQDCRRLSTQSRVSTERSRRLSREILMAQEEERMHISRELHDEISQILTGINVRLAALKLAATANNGNLKTKISSTQRLVEKSVAVVHQFARELRPVMLDDLGLVPALVTFMKEFGRRTGLPVRFATVAASKLEPLDSLKRTVLYRIAQEALTNVAKHAQASVVKVSLTVEAGSVCMKISDDGKSFDVKKVLGAERWRGLGLLGMRERAEMAGGSFAIESEKGQGTTVSVQVPLPARIAKQTRDRRSDETHHRPAG